MRLQILGDELKPLASQTAIPADHADAARRLVHAQPWTAIDRTTVLETLGLD